MTSTNFKLGNLTDILTENLEMALYSKISKISTTYSFSSNTLTFDYLNGTCLIFDGLTSSTNFELVLDNINTSNNTYKSFEFNLLVDTTTYKAFANTCKINNVSVNILMNDGLTNVNINSNSLYVLQQFKIIYQSSGTTPNIILSSVQSLY